MARIDLRALVLIPVLLAAAACGDDATPPVAPPPSPVVSAAPPSAEPSPSDSVYEEQDVDPTAAPGDLSDAAQGYLDDALAAEFDALDSAPPATAATRRATLEKLPDDPTQVLAALKTYKWISPEAKMLYEKAVAAG
jgi:hypothetical protein